MTEKPLGNRILIITSGPASRNPRPRKEAVTLAASGFKVVLLTVFETEADLAEDVRLLGGTSVGLETLRAKRGLGRFLQRLRTWFARRAVRHLSLNLPESLGPAHALLAAANRLPADLTIVHTEAPFWVGRRLISEGRRVAADFEDWHSEDLMPGDRRGRPIKLIRDLEKSMLQQAIYTTTTSRSLSTELARAYFAQPPSIVTNSFPLQPSPGERPRRDAEMVWFSQTIGPGRGLEEFLATWRRLDPPRGRLALIGKLIAGYDRALLDILPESMRKRLSFPGPVTSDDLPGILAGYDIGLALELRTPHNRDLTITNKILQYLNAGLAIIATPTAGQKEILDAAPSSGLAIDFQTPEASGQLADLLGDNDRIRRAQIASRHAAETRFSWEMEARQLTFLVKTALASNG